MLKIPCAGCLGQSPAISAQLLLKCVSQPEITENY